jgi:hypothetical protein
MRRSVSKRSHWPTTALSELHRYLKDTAGDSRSRAGKGAVQEKIGADLSLTGDEERSAPFGSFSNRNVG